MISLVVFDMAGTTVDDRGAVYDALEQAVKNTGATVSAADLQTWMGVDKSEAIDALMRLGGVTPADGDVATAFDDFRGILRRSYDADPPIALAGAEALFTALAAAGIKRALTTGFSSDVAMPLLESLGWSIGPDGDADATGDRPTVNAVITADQVVAGRPAPHLIHHAMEQTSTTDVASVISVGDTAVDLQSARNAGVIGVGVLSGKADRELLTAQPHHYVVDSVADLPLLPELAQLAATAG